MRPQLPLPSRPSKSNALSMLVSKVTSLLNESLTVRQVKQLHGLVIVNGLYHLEPKVVTQILSIGSNYSQSTNLYLQSILRHSKDPDVVSGTSAIQFFCQRGDFREALAQYVRMQRSGLIPSTSSIAFALEACAGLDNYTGGITIHSQVHGYGFCGDVHVGAALVRFYKKLGDMETLKRVVDEMSERNSVSYKLDDYLNSGNLSMAESYFSRMPYKDVASWNHMLLWHTRRGDMEKALLYFGGMPVRNLASWNAMINGYVDLGEMEVARNFYDVMPYRNDITCITMIGGYSKRGAVEAARELFDEMDQKNNLLYDAMIACYVHNNRPEEAVCLFNVMIQPNVNIQPHETTLATVISACSQLGNWSFGSWIGESYMRQMGIAMDDRLATALIDFYAKCGSIDKAYMLFHGLQKKDLVAYTAMIWGCGMIGKKYDAIKLFEEMLEANICPNLVTFWVLLNSLNYASPHAAAPVLSSPFPTHFSPLPTPPGMVQASAPPGMGQPYHGFNSSSPSTYGKPWWLPA